MYNHGKQITYVTDQFYAMSVLTDTTERSPTFSLNPFPNRFDLEPKKCWCNLKIWDSEAERYPGENQAEQQ